MKRNKLENDELLENYYKQADYIQMTLDLGINFKPETDLIDGKPTAGQRWKDACAKGFNGSFLEFLKQEAKQEAEAAMKLGFQCSADYMLSKIYNFNSSDEFYKIYQSCLIPHPNAFNTNYVVEDNKPKRRWSDAAKYKNRLNRLKKRIAKKYSIPEMYEQELQNVLQARPEYFGISRGGE